MLQEEEYPSSTVLLSCLLNAYPESGLTLFNTQDYWTCKELINIASESRVPPEVKLQKQENDKFNIYLQKRADKKLEWMYLPQKHSVRQISNLRKIYDVAQ